MPPCKLVSPERVLYIINDKAALTALGAELNLDGKLRGNLHQLCGFTPSGQGRERRRETSNWQLLEDIKWLQKTGASEVVPVVDKFIATRTDIPIKNVAMLRKLLPSSTGHQAIKAIGQWRVVAMPAVARTLHTGAQLTDVNLLRAECSGSTVADVAAAWAAAVPRDARMLRDAAMGAGVYHTEVHACMRACLSFAA